MVDAFVIGVVSASVDAAEGDPSRRGSGVTDGLAAAAQDAACRGA